MSAAPRWPGRLRLTAQQEQWLAPLQDLAVYPYLVSADRKNFRVRHCLGRQLIKVQKVKASGSLLLTAGVDYSKPTPEHPTELQLTLNGPLNGENFEEVKKNVYRGMIDRYEGHDKDKHIEHRLQSAMKGRPDCFIPTPRSRVEREFPALRPTGRLAFLDFLYVGSDNRLHIVETKIGDDPMLVVQGLDYWLWANANLDQLRRHFDEPEITGVAIDYVVATKADLPEPSSPTPPCSAAMPQPSCAASPTSTMPCTGARDGGRTSQSCIN